MALPIFQNQSDQPFMLMQTQWASQLNPVLKNPITNPRILKEINISTGVNVINTGLETNLQGWFLTDIQNNVTIYRSAPKTSLTLTLTSTGDALVDIVVF